MSYLSAVLSAAPHLKRKWDKKERMALQNAVCIALPKHRAAACLRHRLGNSDVAVSATEKGGTRLSGLMVCNAAHVCPICHHNKMAKDKAITADIVERHYVGGGYMVDAVLTVPHAAGESLVEVLARLEAAWKSLRSKPIWRELTDDLGIVGCIRRLEVTLTPHGWHPHYHVSFLCDWSITKSVRGHCREVVLAEVHALVAGRWSEAGRKTGIAVCLFAQAAVAIVAAVEAKKAIAYNAKNMGFSDKDGGLTPMDLLRIIDQDADATAVHAAKRLFSEYVDAFKGKHALSFLGAARSNKASTAEVDDKALNVDKGERLGTLSADAWNAVVKAAQRETVAQVRTRKELVVAVLRAAWSAGHTSIPIGWLTLTAETKTVREVKGRTVAVTPPEGLLA